MPAKLHDASLQGTRLAFQFELEGVRYRADLYVVDGARMSGVARRTSGGVQGVLPVNLEKNSGPS